MSRKQVKSEPVVGRRRTGAWSQERRLEFIDFRLQWEGRLNRADLMEHFGTSVPQASADIAAYSELAPGNLVYDRSARVYVASQGFVSVFPATTAKDYLNDLLALNAGVLPSQSSFVGWSPSVAIAASPDRSVPSAILVSVLSAIRNRTSVQMLYQSMSRPEPSWRQVSPHALGHDGSRWHVRAYCHRRCAFRDFVFARALEVQEAGPTSVTPESDEAWHSTVSLVLVPNPGLGISSRKVVELDYAMTGGQVVLETRKAMLYYVLQRLGLSWDGELRSETQQIKLKNASEVKAILAGLAKSYD